MQCIEPKERDSPGRIATEYQQGMIDIRQNRKKGVQLNHAQRICINKKPAGQKHKTEIQES